MGKYEGNSLSSSQDVEEVLKRLRAVSGLMHDNACKGAWLEMLERWALEYIGLHYGYIILG